MKNLVLRHVVSVAFAALCTVPSCLHATTIFVENFNELTPALTVTTAGPFSAFGGTNVDVVGGALFGSLCTGPEAGNCVDLGGSGGDALGKIELTSPLNLAAGVYDLSFDLIGSQRGQTTSTTVTFGSYSQTFILTSGDDASGVVVDVPVTIAGGLTQLEFVNNGDGGDPDIGALLDNIEITTGASTAPPTVPEPGTIGLLATGLLGIASLIRRRFAA